MAGQVPPSQPSAALPELTDEQIEETIKALTVLKAKKAAEFVDQGALQSPEERIATLEGIVRSMQKDMQLLRKNHDELQKHHNDLITSHNEVTKAVDAMAQPQIARLGAQPAPMVQAPLVEQQPPRNGGTWTVRGLTDRILGPEMRR